METIKKRSGFGDERYEKAEFQQKVGEQYRLFEQKYKGSKHWITIEADDKSIEQMELEIREAVDAYSGDQSELLSLFKDY